MEAAGAEAKSATTASNRVISPPHQRAHVFLCMCLGRAAAEGFGPKLPRPLHRTIALTSPE